LDILTVFSIEAAENWDLENIRKIFLGFLRKGPNIKLLMMTFVKSQNATYLEDYPLQNIFAS
jgi:hypothetical protein